MQRKSETDAWRLETSAWRAGHFAVARNLLGSSGRMTRMLLLVLSITACGNSGGSGSECHESADCAMGLECSGPDDGPVCGIGPREGCVNDANCTGGQRCGAIADTCSQDGVGSECKNACTVAADCGEGFRCDAGACAAVLCDAGYTCPSHQRCNPGVITGTTPMYDRHHGCVDVPCTSDVACGTDVCVNGICQTGLGACVMPMAVP